MNSSYRKNKSLKIFLKDLLVGVQEFPDKDYPGSGYWHMHMPGSSRFLDYTEKKTELRKILVEGIIKATKTLHDQQPSNLNAKVISCISWPNLFDSQIIVFFGDEYFGGFFDRSGPEQWWTKEDESWVKENMKMEIPDGFEERVYNEVIDDEDGRFESTLIFIGNFKQERQNKSVE